ncbi:NUDIX hydrolase [Frateuria soli]|uniref:NUDIX hydrolase n=1 Tax=Frateuria soli TaxID=1542730 RepID=UPI001E3AFCD1|nr:NUDIX domain-containing protein [Frateuria soli]UGB36820.1 NUDIX domain-containing protein [Frateuria soli]
MHGIPTRCSLVSVIPVRGDGEHARTLLLRRAGTDLHGLWTYAAGHLEAGEKAWQAAVRELAEETGLRPAALYSADQCETYYDVREECIAVVPAFVAHVESDAAVHLDAEHDDYAWLTFPDAIARLPFGGQRTLYAHVYREFVQRPPSAALRMPQ